MSDTGLDVGLHLVLAEMCFRTVETEGEVMKTRDACRVYVVGHWQHAEIEIFGIVQAIVK